MDPLQTYRENAGEINTITARRQPTFEEKVRLIKEIGQMLKSAGSHLRSRIYRPPPAEGAWFDKLRVSGRQEERLYAEPKYNWQLGEIDPPGGKLAKRSIKAVSGKLGKYSDETLHVVGSKGDIYTQLADDIAFDMGAVKTDLVEGHRTPHAAYFRTRKEAEAYKEQIGTSADFISSETRSRIDTPGNVMHPGTIQYGPAGYPQVSEKSSRFRRMPKRGAGYIMNPAIKIRGRVIQGDYAKGGHIEIVNKIDRDPKLKAAFDRGEYVEGATTDAGTFIGKKPDVDFSDIKGRDVSEIGELLEWQ